MDEMTEREKKLVEYLQFCVRCFGLFGLYAKGVTDWYSWLAKYTTEVKIGDMETEILDYLKLEFGLDYTIVDPFKKKEEVNEGEHSV